MRPMVFLAAALAFAPASQTAHAEAWSWADTTDRPCAVGHVRLSEPIQADLRLTYSTGAIETSCWTDTRAGERVRDGLCIVTDASGHPVAEGYFTRGHRTGTWAVWRDGIVTQEYWSGGAHRDSSDAPVPDNGILILDVTYRLPAGRSGYTDLGSYSWKQSTQGADSTRIEYRWEMEMGVSPTFVYRVPRSQGIRVVHMSGGGYPGFRDAFVHDHVDTLGHGYSLHRIYRK